MAENPSPAFAPEHGPVVIVGAGQAGATAARALRTAGWGGRIVLLGDEAHLPYERPPLSKAVLADGEQAMTWAMSAADLQTLDVEHWPRWRCVRVDAAQRELHGEDGRRMGYAALVLATGGRARHLPGIEMQAVHTLRTFDDAMALRTVLQTRRTLIVVGGGWIGLEMAAAARGRGVEVTLLEAASRLCVRSLPPEASQFMCDLHVARGVQVMLGTPVARVERNAEGRSVVDLPDGRRLDADAVVLGAGLVPNAELAVAAGLEIEHGAVLVDACGRTSDPHIFAVGDVSCVRTRWAKQAIRLESWAHAQASGAAAACAIAGSAPGADELPTFWSEQYEHMVQMAGLPAAGAMWIARLADPAKPIWLQWEEGRVTGVVAVSSPRVFRQVRKLIERGRQVDPAHLADAALPLDSL